MSGEYTRINVANNAETELDAAITDSDTSISVLDASVFAEAPTQLTLIDADSNLEIVEVGNVDEANNNLENVTRGVDGTTAQSFDAGSLVEDRFNRGTYNELVGEEGFEGHDHTETEFEQIPNEGLVNNSVTVTTGNALENGGEVSLGESTTLDVEDDGIATDELDLSITPTWTGNHAFEAGLDVDADITDGETVIWDNENEYVPQGRLENDAVTVAGNSVALGGSTDVNYTDLENREHGNEDHDEDYTDYDSTDFDTDFGNKTTDDLTEGTSNEYFKEHGNEDHTETFTTTDEDIENFSTSGTDGSIPVSQGDGTVQMEQVGLEARGDEPADPDDNQVIILNQDIVKPAEPVQVWTYTGHTNWVFGVAADNDENVYSGSRDEEVHKIDSNGNNVWEYTGHTDAVYDVAVDNSGYVYSASWDNEVHKIDSDGNNVWEYTGHRGSVYAVAVDSDGYVYSGELGGLSGDQEVHKIDSDGNNVWEYTGHSSAVESVAVDSDGYVYSASWDNEVHKIDSDGNNVWEYTGHTDDVYSVAVDQDGNVYSASDDNEVHKIDSDGNNIWKYTVHTDAVWGVDVDGDGNVYSAGGDDEVHKIEAEDEEILNRGKLYFYDEQNNEWVAFDETVRAS